MAQAEVMREFLVSLGFKTDEKSLKKFTEGVEGATKNVAKLVTTIAGMALTVGAGVAAFAANMEALYFSTMKMGASALNAKAFEKAMANFGVASGEALQSVQSLAKWMRATPASEGFLRSLGVEARDANGNLRDTTDIMASLGLALKSKPYHLALQYAQIFGISEDVLRAMLNGDFEREMEKQRRALKDSGYDEAAKKAHEFGERLRELQTKIEAVGVSVGLGALKWIEKYNPAIQATIDLVMKLVDALGSGAKFLADFGFRATSGAIMLWRLVTGDTKGARQAAQAMVDGMEKADGRIPSTGSGSGGSRMSSGKIGNLEASGTPQERLAALEAKYGLPAGLLDRIWATESGRGKFMRSPAGAMGHFQFMPGTAKQYGLENPDDFDQSADAAARFSRDLLKKYGGDLEKAVAAYNWGPGNVDRFGLGRAPAETRGYLDKVLGSDRGAITIAQNTTINVNGGDAAATGRAVAGEQNSVNQTQIRNLKTALN